MFGSQRPSVAGMALRVALFVGVQAVAVWAKTGSQNSGQSNRQNSRSEPEQTRTDGDDESEAPTNERTVEAEDDETAGEEEALRQTDATEKLRVVEPDEEGMPEVHAVRGKISGAASFDLYYVGGLLVQRGVFSVLRKYRFVDVGLRFGAAYLNADNTDLAFYNTGVEQGEYDVAAIGRVRLGRSVLEGVVGGNLRHSLSLGYASLRFQRPFFGSRLHISVDGALNEVVDSTLSMRLLGVRDRVRSGIAAEFWKGLYMNVAVDAHGYQSRLRETLGTGFGIDAEVGYRFHLSRYSFDLKLRGYYEYNSLPQTLPDGILHRLDDTSETETGSDTQTDQETGQEDQSENASSETEDYPADDLLISRYALLGGGFRLQRGLPREGRPALRLYLLLDVWLGWLWAPPGSSPDSGVNALGYDVQLGIGFRFPGRVGVLTGTGYVSNSRAGGFGNQVFGAALKYSF